MAAFGLFAVLSLTTGVEADGETRESASSLHPSLRQSIGFPFQGRLQNGVLLRESAYIRHMPDCLRRGRFYGTGALVRLIEGAAYRVAQRVPGGARLSVGELSARTGGRVTGHNSHQNGRDADLAFYIHDAQGRPREATRFINFRSDGQSREAPGIFFDDVRNWEMIAKLVSDGSAQIQYIFVSGPLRERLLRTGASRAPRAIVERARRALVVPREGHPHANHFHVRIYCPEGDRPTCRDRGPWQPWYR